MVEFEIVPALVAGLSGTVVMSAAMEMERRMGMTSMDITLITGGMMTGDRTRGRQLGMFVHIVIMGTIVFGIAYALIFQAFDSDSIGTGLAIGLIHGSMLGLLAMPMMATIHPRMQAGAEGFTLDAPGPLA